MNSKENAGEIQGHDDKTTYSAPYVEVLSTQSTAGPNASLDPDTVQFGEFS
ncbi:MAG: hypothetical protein JJU31_08610 [Wenzhouxiangella sp.]|nr:hypothetical protein [Wenzhouxiangella sp.]